MRSTSTASGVFGLNCARRGIATLFTMWFTIGVGTAEAQVDQQSPGSNLTVFLATFGPGDAVWENFGHNAIWIHDPISGSTISYNYGIFDFNQVGFVPRLMKGSMLYSMGVHSAEAEIDAYTRANRSVTVQRLNLSPEQKHALREFLEWNWLPGNRDYVYDYFRDNCSTRLRDALDRALGGQIHEALSGATSTNTYRSHSLRLTARSLPTFTGLLLGLGLPTDKPLTAWDESFIPMELMQHLRGVTVTDAGGRAVPLVVEERVIFEANRAPPREHQPERTAGFLFVGLLAAAGIAALAHAARGRRLARLGLATAVSVWGVATGFFGLILLLLWTLTDHTASYPNLNLLIVNPIGWLLAVAAPLALADGASPGPHAGRRGHGDAAARGERPGIARVARPTAMISTTLAVAALLLVPFVPQYNTPLIALLGPVHVAILFALYHAARVRLSPIEDEGRALLPVSPS